MLAWSSTNARTAARDLNLSPATVVYFVLMGPFLVRRFKRAAAKGVGLVADNNKSSC
jgi:hypothetical protein